MSAVVAPVINDANEPRQLYAMVERSHLLSGIFRSLRKGERKTSKLDITYQLANGGTMRVRGAEPLGIDDLRVLLALLAIGGASGPDAHDIAGDDMASKGFPIIQKEIISVHATWLQLSRQIGCSYRSGVGGGKNHLHYRDSIERMSGVSVIIAQSGKRYGHHLISGYASGRHGMRVSINPLLSSVFVGQGPRAQHTHIPMDDVRQLDDATTMLYSRLASWIDPGGSGQVGIDTMVGYIWGDITATPSTRRKRAQRVRAALTRLRGLSWKILDRGKGQYLVCRPALPSLAF